LRFEFPEFPEYGLGIFGCPSYGIRGSCLIENTFDDTELPMRQRLTYFYGKSAGSSCWITPAQPRRFLVA
jgi:hypothetical protein